MGAGRVALVTGASRGVGKGIAVALAKAGAFVYLTARSYSEHQIEKRLPGSLQQVEGEIIQQGGQCKCLQADHTNDQDTKRVIDLIKEEKNQLDILVNNAFAIPKPAGQFFGQPFYTQPIEFFDTVTKVGLRNHYVCTVYASEMLIQSKGLVVNISSAGGQNYLFNVSYGVTKCAVDKLSVDMAHDFQPHGVCCICLWPGVVKTERMVMGAALMGGIDKVEATGESPHFVGDIVAALATDPQKMDKTGKIWSTRRLGQIYSVSDGDKIWDIDPANEPENIFK